MWHLIRDAAIARIVVWLALRALIQINGYTHGHESES